MRNRLPSAALVPVGLAALLLALLAPATAGAPDARPVRVTPPTRPEPETVRELYVPFEDLHPILQGDPNRVLLSRSEYEDLLEKAKKEDERRPPRSALLVSADYQARLQQGRAEITARLTVSVLAKGLHAVGLDVAGVGLRAATLDGKSAPIGLADDGRLTLFVEGLGRHELVLEVVAPLETTAARQVLSFRLPTPPAARMRLSVPGDVEVKSGAPVAARHFDEKAEVTRIEILPKLGDVVLVMTLNSRLLRRDRVVVARSVLLDEVTAALERLHATVSMEILHRAVRQFRFAVPDGFEVTDVRTPNLSRWAIEKANGRAVLAVHLRDETTETVVLNISAVRTGPDLAAWSLSKFEPLEVLGHVSVVGVAVEDRLKAEALAPQGLIPIDTVVLTRALPATVLEPQPGAARIRPVAAFYAPHGRFALSARIVRPPARLHVTTNVLAVLEDAGLTVRGGFALLPEQERLFALDFSAPAGWDVTEVTGADGKPIPFQRYGRAEGGARIHVRLPAGVTPGTEHRLFFKAVHVPKGWFGRWEDRRRTLAFPVFAVLGTGRGPDVTIRDTGAIAVDARDDMIVRPDVLEGLMPLDSSEKQRYGLEGASASLAYRYDRQPYRARLTVRRAEPRITAQTFSFFRVERDALAAHYEIVYEVGRARTRRVALRLPIDTPTALSIRGLGGVDLKEYASRVVGEGEGQARLWTAMLAEPRRGTVRLAVDFEQRLEELEPEALALPVVEAAEVAYQSGLVAVEGSAELDVRVTDHPRRVDIGELVDAEYQPGRRLLGVYAFLGTPPAVRVSVGRHPGLGLPPAIVQRAELATVLSADGLAQTSARFLLKTKSLFLDVRLPPESVLWSATLDGQPVKPRREGNRLLLNLPAGPPAQTRDLRVVFQTPVSGLAFWKGVRVPAPRLFLHAAEGGEGVEVPAADLLWRLYPPTGYRVVRTEGSVVTDEVQAPPLAIANVAGVLYAGTGGVNFDHGALGLVLEYGVLPFGGCALEQARAPSASDRQMGGAEGEDTYAYTEVPERPSEAASRETGGIRGRKGPVTSSGVKPGMETEELKTDLPKHMFEGVPRQITPAPALDARLADEADSSLELRNGDKPVPDDLGTVAGDLTGADRPPGTAAESVAGPETKPAEKPPPPAKAPAKPEPPAKKKPTAAVWALEGLSSLTIALQQTGPAVEFKSLGADPAMAVTCVHEVRLGALAWGLALAVFVVGVALTTRSFARKAAYVIGVGVVATLVPVITGRVELALAVNGAFYAACLLVPYYLAAHVVRWAWGKVASLLRPRTVAAPTAAVVLLGLLLGLAASAMADEKDRPYVVQIVPPEGPVKVPADAIIVPYDPESKTGIQGADRLLVPYKKYVELWNRAYPEEPIGKKPPPAPYALAGASLSARLQGEEFILFEGYLDIDVFTDEYVTVPLPLSGGVLARADLDGSPARVSVVEAGPGPRGKAQQAEPKKAAKAAKQAAPAPASFVVLYVEGKGRHRLEVSVRMRLSRRGGWRVAEGHLPAGPATALALTVPKVGTEVRLEHVRDQSTYETEKAGQVLQTALGAGGALRLQWRPKVGEGRIERTLTADSFAVLDVREDRLEVLWRLGLEFRHGEREAFTFRVPAGYIVEKVEGTNVRGWQREDVEDGQRLTVTLLKPAKEREGFTVRFWRQTAEGAVPGGGRPILAPILAVEEAIRHTGTLAIRRSPLIDLRTVETESVRRTNLPAEKALPETKTPLGLRPYQAYGFVRTPFAVQLAAEPVSKRVTAAVQTILRLAERQRRLEARAVLTVQDRPLYVARLAIPETLDLDRVQAPGTFEWAVTKEAGRRILTVYLSAGVQGRCPVVIEGQLARGEVGLETPLPRLEVLDVRRQTGDIVVQVDPAFDVRPLDLENIERAEHVSGWLSPGQKALAVLALSYRRPDYAGRLVLEPRKPDVSCFTVTNARVTDRSVDETILLAWTIQKAGIREVAFLLPAWMAEARISAPLLRQKTVEPVSEAPGAPVRVRLTLQDQVMDELRVLVENDRLLEGEVFEAPVPVVETGRTTRRYVALESAGRDEVIVTASEGLAPLSRRQKEWAAVAGMLRGGTTRAFIVSPGASRPRLAFRTKRRKAVETVQARIGLAETDLVMDASGAYRGQVVYHIDNRTEQFLEIALPEGADLWTAVVAGEPVKPTRIEGGESALAGQAGRVRIPIVKTAEGDLDYAVVLKYGGVVGRLGAMQYRVRFPLVRTLNIEAELGQVRLYVPEEYVWIDFDTDMTRVEEAGTLEAGVLQYQWKLAGRLLQTLRSDNPFAQTRARSNLKQIGRSIAQHQQTLQMYYRNEAVQAELSNAGVVLEQVDKELGEQPQVGQVTAAFNDALMREAYEKQRNRRDRNLVQDLGANWDMAGRAPEGQEANAYQFDAAWLAETQLENKAAQVEQAKPQARFQHGGPQQTMQQAAQMPQSQIAGDMFKQFAGKVAKDQAEIEQQAADDLKRRHTAAEVVERYQRKLEARQKADEEVRGRRIVKTRERGGGEILGGFEGLGTGRGFFGAGEAAAEAEEVPEGLASLDVQLPRRGRLFQFTMPMPPKDVAIEATTASAGTIEGAERAAGVAVLILVLLAVRRWLRGRSFGVRAQSIASTVLIILGVVGVFFGVFPLAGLVAVVVGVGVKVYLFFARRQSVATA